VLDVAYLQLYFVSAKKESCLPLYIVPGSHRIDCESSTILAHRWFVLLCIIILLPIIVIHRRAFHGFSRKNFSRKNLCSRSSFDLLLLCYFLTSGIRTEDLKSIRCPGDFPLCSWAAPRSINWIDICSPAALAWLRSKPQLWFGRSDLQDRYSFRRSSVRRYLRRFLRSKSSLSISTEAVAVSVIRLSRRDRVLFRSIRSTVFK
jgi:hypothetical protein